MKAWMILVAGACFGQTPARLTCEQAVAVVLDRHPDILAARASLAVAEASIQAASALPDPEIRFTTNSLAIDPDQWNTRTNASLRWSPPRPREISLGQRSARAKQRIVEAEVRGVESRLASKVRNACRLAELTGQRAELAARTVNLRREMLEVVRRQVASGLKPSIEADMAELAKGDAEVDHHRLSAQVETALLGLSRLINLQGGSGFTLVPSLSATSDPSFPPPEASLVAARAMENHPGLAAQAAACQSVDADRAVATNQRYPWLSSIQVSRRLSRPSDAGNWSVQVGVNLPLFRSPAAAAERIAAVRHQGCLLELEALRSRIRREAEESAEALRQAAGQLARLNALATETATRVLEQTRKALATGLADRFDLLTAEARQLSLRDRWFQHRLEYATLEQRLELAIGGPLDTP